MAKMFSSKKIEVFLFTLIILFLPTQLGKHFWPEFAIVNGIRVDYLSPTLYLTDVFIIALFLLKLPQLSTSIFRHKRSILFFWLTVLFLLIGIISSMSIPNGLYSLIKFLELAFFCHYVAKIRPKVITIEQIVVVLGIGVVIQSALAIAQFISQSSIGGPLYFLGERAFNASTPGIANASLNGELVMRAYGTFPHPNVLAGYLLISMVLIFTILFPVSRLSAKLFATSSLLIGTIGIVLTLSRVAILLWFGFIIMVLIWQIVRTRFTKTKLQASVVLVTLFVVGISFSQLLLPRFLQTALIDESVTQRQVLIDAALVMINQNPFLGVGLGNFLTTLSTVQSPLSLSLYLQPVHNIFLLIAAETGLVGIGLFIWFLGKSFRQVFLFLRNNRQTNYYLALVICLTMIMLLGLFDHYWLTLQQGQLLLILILGFVWQ